MKIIDLTKTIETGMEAYPGDPDVNIQLVHTYEQHSWQLRELKLGSHSGTHVDAFSHMHKGAQAIDQIPLTKFFGKAIVFDYVNIDRALPRNVGIFFTCSEIGLPLLDKIIEANPPFVGGNLEIELQRELLKREIVTYTDLINLDKIPIETPFTFYGFPLKIKDGDGSPVRAIAVIESVTND